MARSENALYDLIIIGGGINGAGIARDAAGRGLSVLLCEKGDLGGATSAASTKLIHGGLRYLEHFEFKLVRQSLKERSVLLGMAPHIIWPLRFVLPHGPGGRPVWMVRAGLYLYDLLAGFSNRLGRSRAVELDRDPAGAPLADTRTGGFAYWDCWVQDNRLVILNAMDAADRGADIRPRTAAVAAERKDAGWTVTLEDGAGRSRVRGRALVNAAGPWAARLLGAAGAADANVISSAKPASLRLVRGSHIVTRALFGHDSAYLFQNPDDRVIFAIPYERDFTLIGTTDVEHEGGLESPQISAEETAYLIAAANRYFAQSLREGDVMWSYAGVRPLYDDESASASAVTRDYVLDLQAPADQAPLMNVFGGKLTTYRKLSERVVGRLAPLLGNDMPAWTAGAVLPGGDLDDGADGGDFDAALSRFRAQNPWLPERLAWRLLRNYGRRTQDILGDASSLDDLGRHFGGGLYEAELAYGCAAEWVARAEDFLWRRSKLGLVLSAEERAAVADWLERRQSNSRDPAYRHRAS